MTSFASDDVWRSRYLRIEPAVDNIILPGPDRLEGRPDQDREWCEILVDGRRERIRFHDYDTIFRHSGLYEAIFYERLECCSPNTVVHLLESVLRDLDLRIDDLRVLDLGAGNGMVGDELAARNVRHVVGVDLLEEAREAAERDRPGLYADYFVGDLTAMDDATHQRIRAHELNALTSVAALGYDDIPPEAFARALDLVAPRAWLAFNLKEDFLRENDATGFARLVRDLSRHGVLQTWCLRRYQHRRSVTGEPLYYVAMIARKLGELPDELRP